MGDWVRRAVDEESEANHVFLKLRPQLMTGPWANEESPLATIPAIGGFGSMRADRKWTTLSGRS